MCSGYWIFGPYPGALYDMRISVRGGHWTGGIAIVASNGFNHRYYFDDCRFEGESAVFELVPDGFAQALNPPGLDVHEYRNCVWDMTYQTESGCFILQSRTDSGVTQRRRIILDNCRLAAAHTPVFTKWWNPGDRIVLRGTTVLLPGPGQPLQTLLSPNDKPSYPDADVFTDERIQDFRPAADPAAAGTGGLRLAALPEYTASQAGAQVVALPVGAVGVVDLNVLEADTNAVRALYGGDYSVSNAMLTLSPEASLLAGDKVTGYYFTMAGVESPDPAASPVTYQAQSDATNKYSDVVLTGAAQLRVQKMLNASGFNAQLLHADTAEAFSAVRTTTAAINADIAGAFAAGADSVVLRLEAAVVDAVRPGYLLFTL